MSEAVRVGVVGLGYWGPNLARNFDRLPGAELRVALRRIARDASSGSPPAFPDARTSADLDELLADDSS